MNRFEEPRQITSAMPLLPHIQKPKVPDRDVSVYPVGRPIKRFLKKITGIRSQDDLNQAVLKGLRYQFNQARVDAVIEQAFTIRQSNRPDENRPELYELYETGEIDRALDMFKVKWVIGRPKIGKSR
jgi:hypothetical protein